MATRNSAKPLTGTRIVSLALNLPGPAALMRLSAMGARCLKVEPPGPVTPAGRPVSGDPMGQYDIGAYSVMHEDVRVVQMDLKTERGQAQLARELLRIDADRSLLEARRHGLRQLRYEAWDTAMARVIAECAELAP